MAASKALKTTDRQNILKDLTSELKKRYKGNAPKSNRSVMETLLYAVLLEDDSFEVAETAFQQLLDAFFDLNEVRVSSITEIERAIGKIVHQDWKALRVRESLQYIFEKQYSFDLEPLKRKTQEVAQKELEAFPNITPFVKTFVLQACLGAHLIPLDPTMFGAVAWLGLTAYDSDSQHAADELKTATKKADAPHLCYLLKSLALDEKLCPAFRHIPKDADPFDAVNRLKKLIKDGPPPPPAKTGKPPAPAAQESKVGKSAAKPEKAAPASDKPAAGKSEKVGHPPDKSAKKPVPAPAVKTVTKKKPEQKAAPGKLTGKPASKTASPKKVTKKKPTKKPTSRPGKK